MSKHGRFCKKLKLCLVIIFVFCFLKLVLRIERKKKIMYFQNQKHVWLVEIKIYKKNNYQIYPKSPRIENSPLILPFLVVKDNGQLKKKKKRYKCAKLRERDW